MDGKEKLALARAALEIMAVVNQKKVKQHVRIEEPQCAALSSHADGSPYTE